MPSSAVGSSTFSVVSRQTPAAPTYSSKALGDIYNTVDVVVNVPTNDNVAVPLTAQNLVVSLSLFYSGTNFASMPGPPTTISDYRALVDNITVFSQSAQVVISDTTKSFLLTNITVPSTLYLAAFATN